VIWNSKQFCEWKPKGKVKMKNGTDVMTEVELTTVMTDAPLTRTLEKQPDVVDVFVESAGVTVSVRGDRAKPAILTYHDLGLNAVSNFQAFSNFPEVGEILKNFCVYNVNAPGMEENAQSWPEEEPYPDMDQLADQVTEVLNHLAVVKYIGIGVGMGGNILLRHALKYPERVDSLMLVSTSIDAPGWIEWGYQKRNISHMRTHGVTQVVMDFLLWHHFGAYADERAHDLVNHYKHYFGNEVNAVNLARLTEQWIWRKAVDIKRETNFEGQGDTQTLKVPVLNIVGSFNPFVEETVTLNGCLNPSNTNWIKVQDCAMVIEEQPGKMAEAFRLFLQGQGYCLKLKSPLSRNGSLN